MQEEYECCKIQGCSKKLSESLESINCNFCCKSEEVINSGKSLKTNFFKKQRKTVDKFYPSSRCEPLKSSDKINSKLSCIIKKLNHLIDTFPSENESLNDCSVTNKSTSTTAVTNSPSGIICVSKSSCSKELVENIDEKMSQEDVSQNVTPEVNTNAILVKSPSEAKISPNDCLAVVKNGITIGFIRYSKIDPCEVSCSKLSCNIELVKNDCGEPSQDLVVPADNCHNEAPVVCLSEIKIQQNLTQSVTDSPVDISTKQNVITTVSDCSNENSCCEFRSTELCAEVEDKNQKEDCHSVDNNYSVIKDDETYKNIDTKDSAKPPIKTIKNITKPKTSNKQKLTNLQHEDIKVKSNSKHNKLTVLKRKI